MEMVYRWYSTINDCYTSIKVHSYKDDAITSINPYLKRLLLCKNFTVTKLYQIQIYSIVTEYHMN